MDNNEYLNKYEFNKLNKLLSKLRFTIRYLLDNTHRASDLPFQSDLIILWGEVAITTQAGRFDGTSNWAQISKHILNSGLAHVVCWARRAEEVELIKVSGLVKELRNIIFAHNGGSERPEVQYGYLILKE